ncbi:FAD-dependent oxidoreductase [filamentous cyanobacterium CCP3]|nr:FAD-dependent oxidoreductase [filamentous cyanobacterium CCP3]
MPIYPQEAEMTLRSRPPNPMPDRAGQRPRVVIVGAGFGGLTVALQLAHAALEVVLIDRHAHHTFQPLLHQVATAELEPSQIAYPIRQALRRATNVRFVRAEVVDLQTQQRRVETSVGSFAYDSLVVATGSRPQLDRVPGARSHAFALKTVSDALAIQNQVLSRFEQALHTADPATQQECLTVAIAGGGPTGVELAGALAEWMHTVLVKDYGQLDCRQIRLVLLHSGADLLPGFHPRLQRYAHRHLQRRGVEVRLRSRVQAVTATAVHLADGTVLPTRTLIWTAGVVASRTDRRSDRLPLRPTLQLLADPQVYALGDVAGDLPMLASTAVQQGGTVANKIERPLPFRHRPRGAMAILGRHAAVMQVGRLSATGVVAWGLWLAVHLLLLRGLPQRLLTLLHWWQSYWFRDRIAQGLWSSAPPQSDRFAPHRFL